MTFMIQRDPHGAFGPAMAVFDTARTLKTKNLAKYTLILEENFKRLAGFSPSGRIEFCAEVLHSKEQATPLNVAQILGSQFFKSMQKENVPPQSHEKALRVLAPVMTADYLKERSLSEEDQQLLYEWIAKFVVSYVSNDQILNYMAPESKNANQFIQKRKEIGTNVYNSVLDKSLIKEDYQILIETLKSTLKLAENAKNPALVLDLIGKYAQLFAMHEKAPIKMGDSIITSYKDFERKMFPENASD
ncbi:hypothetical protein [Parachlamydia acanthamoebae]|uniref:hypothetical protein n=1 Tax=Parachlamydia acanthamoebae TaxID=83552 RepID=UPI000751A0AA|nr:hypothetical protein [Parachlamydia acanthamoebae]